MELRLLGPVDLEVGGVAIGVGGPRAQAVLALLAVYAGEVVTADWLIDQLWGERPPRSARVALQAYVSRLRGLAGADTERMLPRRSKGYVLDTGATDIDAQRFVQLSEQGRRAAADRRWRDARRSFRGATGLWRGTPFTGLDEVAALCAERTRLEEFWVETRLCGLHAALETDGPAEVIGPVREMVDINQWDERARRLLMLALYRAGRQTEALEVAAEARRLLVAEQGLDPSPALADLERRILVHDPSLDPADPLIRLRGWLGVPATPSVGREPQRRSLLAEWAAVTDERRARLAMVEGEPGVGKSHFVAWFAAEIEAVGNVVLAGRCLDAPRLPLQPWSDLVPDAGGLASDVPAEFNEGHPLADVWEVAAHRLFVAIKALFGRALEAGPALLVVEDVHWAGATALRLLDHVLATCAHEPLLVLATARSSGTRMSPVAKGALGELTARAQPHTVRLQGLDVEDLQKMLVSQGYWVDETEATSLWERTGGVPLLALEALRGGNGVLAARLGQLSSVAVDLVELLAAVGDSQPLAVVRAASGLDEESLEHTMDELLEAGLVRSQAGYPIAYEFTHSLYRESLVARLSSLRRLVLSRRVLAASDQLKSLILPSAVAHHALIVARSGAPVDVLRARDACEQAGSWATGCHEHHDAVRWLSEARELCRQAEPDDRKFAELELAYGFACRRAGVPQARDAFLRAAALARRVPDHSLLARIGLAWSRGFFSQVAEVDTEFVAILREALAAPERLSAGLRARTTAALAAELTWAADAGGEERFGLADAALDLARRVSDPATLAYVLATRHLTVAAADTLAVRRRDTTELLALATQLDDVGLRFDALFHRSGPAIEDGEIGLIEDLLAKAGQIADLLRQPALQWSIGWSRASLLLWQGALPAAEELSRESAELGMRAGHPTEATAFFAAQLMEIRRLQGRLQELAPTLEAVPAETLDGFSVPRYLYAAGRVEAARARLDRLQVHGGRIRLRRDMLERPSLDNLAFLAARLDRRDLVDALRVRLEPLADTFGHGVVAHPVGHHWLGVLAVAAGRPVDGVAHLRQAAIRHAQLGLPLLEAESQLELARAYEAAHDAVAADRARAAARRLASAQGAVGLAQAATQPNGGE